MKKKLMTMILLTMFTYNCASAKPNQNLESKGTTTEVREVNTDPTLKLLVSGLVLYILHTMFTR